MNEQQKLIEHEIKIGILKETTESKFLSMQKNIEDKFEASKTEFALMMKNSDDRFTAMEKNNRAEFDLMMKNSDDRFAAMQKTTYWAFGINVTCIFAAIFLKVIGAF
jgi:hypothetical protein